MKEQIGERIIALCAPIVQTFLSEAETESYPYAVYDQTVTEKRTKDGVYQLSSDMQLRVFSNSFEEADSIAGQLHDALVAGMAGPQFVARAGLTIKSCIEGIWTIERDFNIKQNS